MSADSKLKPSATADSDLLKSFTELMAEQEEWRRSSLEETSALVEKRARELRDAISELKQNTSPPSVKQKPRPPRLLN